VVHICVTRISSSEEYVRTVRTPPDFCNRVYLYVQVAHAHSIFFLRVKSELYFSDSRQKASSDSSGNPPITQVATTLIMQNFKA